MKYDYDLICIGLGPAGMAISIMGSEMGLKVCGIEKNKIGGECMNVGCIPSKSLLRMASARRTVQRLADMELERVPVPGVRKPFQRIQLYIKHINEKKTVGMFKKVDLKLGAGEASFVDPHTVKVGDKEYTARRIFIATGTRPAIPPVPGIDAVETITNENIFSLDSIPASMTIIGGGAIGCEMAQAFSRLGCKCSIIHMDRHLIPIGDPEAAKIIEEQFAKEGIPVYNGRKIERVEKRGDKITLIADGGLELLSDKLLVAAGRRMDFDSLKLENAGVKYGKRGIEVNSHLQTSRGHIYAAGDCNGQFLLSHAAMHQGMIALMNSMIPWPFKMNFRKFVVPWTVFTEPQVSHVGKRESDLTAKGVKFQTIKVNYEDYGAAIAEACPEGFVKAYSSYLGRIYGASIVGEGSGEMINEWGLAIQKGARMHDIMMLQHSFPTMGFLTKRVSETWMMGKMGSEFLKGVCRTMFRL